MKKHKYTVILLYPDYSNDDFGGETYVDFATSHGVHEAVKEVQGMAYQANEGDEGIINDPEDFRAIAVIRGHHTLECYP